MTAEPATPEARKGRRWLRRLRTSLLALGIGLVLAEMVLRLAGYAEGPAVYFDPDLGFRYHPNQTRKLLGPEGKPYADVKLNAGGFRGPWFDGPKPPGVIRIACVGDSFTFGWGVGDHQTYPQQLADSLDGIEGPGRVEVLNFGMPGYNTWNELQLYRKVVRQFDPDVVVLGFFHNDLEPNAVGPTGAFSSGNHILGSTALMEVWRDYFRGGQEAGMTLEERRRVDAFRDNQKEIQLDPRSELARPYLEVALANLDLLVEEILDDEVDLFLLCFPTMAQSIHLRNAAAAGRGLEELTEKYCGMQAILREKAAEYGIPYIDPMMLFAWLDEEPFGMIDRAHPSRFGYRATAAAVLSALQENGVL